MLQITPQMRILVAVDAVDGRKGIDSLVQLCGEKLALTLFPAACSSSEAAVQPRFACLLMTYRAIPVMCSKLIEAFQTSPAEEFTAH